MLLRSYVVGRERGGGVVVRGIGQGVGGIVHHFFKVTRPRAQRRCIRRLHQKKNGR